MFSRLTPIVKNLLIINVILHVLQEFMGINLNQYGGLRHITAEAFLPFQFVTYMFLHGGFWHLFSNMFALFMFGPMLETVWGSKRFLIFYLVTGIGAGILYSGVHYYELNTLKNEIQVYAQDPDPYAFTDIIRGEIAREDLADFVIDFEEAYSENAHDPEYQESSIRMLNQMLDQFINSKKAVMVGASGSIFGILLAFGMLFPNTELMLLFPPIPIKAKYFVFLYGVFELIQGVRNVPGDNVAHYAHLAGMLIAFILLKIWGSNRSQFY